MLNNNNIQFMFNLRKWKTGNSFYVLESSDALRCTNILIWFLMFVLKYVGKSEDSRALSELNRYFHDQSRPMLLNQSLVYTLTFWLQLLWWYHCLWAFSHYQILAALYLVVQSRLSGIASPGRVQWSFIKSEGSVVYRSRMILF